MAMGSSTQAYHDPEFLREVWILYAIGMLVFGLRIAVRARTVGLKRWQGDDYMAIVVIFCYTADAVTVTETYLKGSNVDYTASQVASFDQDEIRQVTFGSKMQLFAWYTYTALVWSLKACMLFFLDRLTFGLPVQNYVKALAIVCITTYVAVFLTITCGCHPIQLNWAVLPYPPRQCTLRAQNMYVATILNVLTDGAMLAIPVPLLWKLNVPLKKKITMGILLSSGVFVITAALVRIVMTLKAHPSALTINRWGVRETLAGIIAVNAPIVRPFFSRAFWTKAFGKPESARRRPALNSSRSSRTIGSASFQRPAVYHTVDFPATDLSENSKKPETASTARIDLASSVTSDQSRVDDEITFREPDSRPTSYRRLWDTEEGVRDSPSDGSVLTGTTLCRSTSDQDLCAPPPIWTPPPVACSRSHWSQRGFWKRHCECRRMSEKLPITNGNNDDLPRHWR